MQKYQVLARKYRPSKLMDISGQDVLVRTMINSIEIGRIHHAFLFTGTRGVGKTTMARIIALSLNCIGKDGNVSSPTINPCLECIHCKQIITGNHPDIIEFDAASKTGVDSMREVIDSCVYPPIMARNKVYIIDEVHMLSKAAFNALLKTLEEPPRNIRFIFATTEIKKVPITIVSRCQKFVLRNFTTEMLCKHLGNVLQKEGFEAEDKVLITIAKMAAGSARDGLSLLDQAISMTGDEKTITFENIKKMFSITESKMICDLFKSIVFDDRDNIKNIISEINSCFVDISFIINDFLEILSLCTKYLVYEKISDECDVAISALIEEIKENINSQMIFRMWQIAIKALDDIKVINRSIVLDIMIGKMLFSVSTPAPMEILQKMQNEAFETAEKLFTDK